MVNLSSNKLELKSRTIHAPLPCPACRTHTDEAQLPVQALRACSAWAPEALVDACDMQQLSCYTGIYVDRSINLAINLNNNRFYNKHCYVFFC